MRARSWWTCAVFLLVACGTDPSPDDTSRDAQTMCESDSDCDDGVFCNGVEQCDPDASDSNAYGCVSAESECEQGCNETTNECVNDCVDADGDGSMAAECGGDDCDDDDADRHPGATEICDADNRDEDCDATTVGGRDADGDGYIDIACCNLDTCGTDCDDSRADVHPDEAESCDSIDNDCDGNTDETGAPAWPDNDGDGYGDSTAAPVMGCPPPGYVTRDGDCDDTDGRRSPGLMEVCDTGGLDEDCDPTTLGGVDADGDGHVSDACCNGEPGSLVCGTDCDDSLSGVNPDMPELCDGLDTDCSGDDVVEDEDGDMFAPIGAACSGGYPKTDCHDLDDRINPNATEDYTVPPSESCRFALDNDCDGQVDEDGAAPCPGPAGSRCPPCQPGGCSCSWTRQPCDLDGDGLCDDVASAGLLITEVVEGSSFNKAVELTNLGGSTVDLADCELVRVVNAGTGMMNGFQPTGSLSAGASFVVCNPDFGTPAQCDATSTIISHNGDDAYTLSCNGVLIDSFGATDGMDPGDEWSGGGVSTRDTTLRRHCSVLEGDVDTSSPFDPSLEWDEYPQDTLSDLGSHCE